MALEKRNAPTTADPESIKDAPWDYMEYIYPLEEVTMGRSTDFHYVRVPTEQGKMLLEFLKRHAFGGSQE